MDKLFSPTVIAGVELSNRVVMPPMTTRLADDEGFVTDALVAYYMARARGGVGLITVEMASPEKAGRHRFREMGIYDDRFLPGLERLVNTLHEAGARVSVQLGHGGSRVRQAVSGEEPIAPSSLPTHAFEVEAETIVPLEMSKDRIEQTTRAFVQAARRARSAGFDFVELHAAHGYLISQFLSTAENRRTDEYGGSLENRARFGLEILRRIKHEVPGLPVVYRLGVEDFFPGGLTLEEGVRVARWAEQAGADVVSVTAAHYRSLPGPERMIPPMAYPEGTFLGLAERVKREVNIPIVGVGRLGNPAVARNAIESGIVDLVALGRTLIADPEWVNKTRSGRAARRCLSCNHCVNSMRTGRRLSCVVNPTTGFEVGFANPTPPRGEKICVVGAGPAGLSYASLVADQNQVTVIERASVPGGSFRYTGKAPLFEAVEADERSFEAYIAELERACREREVEFRYGIDVAEQRDVLAPYDRVVFATGASYRYGLRRAALALLDAGLGKSALARRLFARPRLRQLLYYRLRKGTGEAMAQLAGPGQKIEIIGGAAQAGKARDAIDAAFRTALLGESVQERGGAVLNRTA